MGLLDGKPGLLFMCDRRKENVRWVVRGNEQQIAIAVAVLLISLRPSSRKEGKRPLERSPVTTYYLLLSFVFLCVGVSCCSHSSPFSFCCYLQPAHTLAVSALLKVLQKEVLGTNDQLPLLLQTIIGLTMGLLDGKPALLFMCDRRKENLRWVVRGERTANSNRCYCSPYLVTSVFQKRIKAAVRAITCDVTGTVSTNTHGQRIGGITCDKEQGG
ncbi:hypothetical protein CDAR_242681 [Caerostris darwini]|uniref:Uncharacterized protein n=1 Tax=Caerostris darwini TaxID=1538125 RepID=A0AAV4N2F9_9ARAC|nr:hypothetical protein CDAR_242681 [Caerostris darwini]